MAPLASSANIGVGIGVPRAPHRLDEERSNVEPACVRVALLHIKIAELLFVMLLELVEVQLGLRAKQPEYSTHWHYYY